MSITSLRLPDSLHKVAKELAKKDHISINQFITTAVAEKISALLTEEYLEKRAKRASKEHFKDIMSRVPDIEPEEYDRFK
ncbi:MAG: DUF6290 family protein [Spirochaetota bacterium]|nr:DUF6290 family protein [Spirochaetota bacterium]